jgi:hypothetical protein
MSKKISKTHLFAKVPGKIQKMVQYGDDLIVITETKKMFMISNKGKVSEVTLTKY